MLTVDRHVVVHHLGDRTRTITLNNANLLTGAVSLNTSGASGNASLTNNLAGGLVLGTSTSAAT